MRLVDGCVRWACQVGVSGGRVRWVWHTYLMHPPATPTCYSSRHFHVSMLLICQVGVSGGRVRLSGGRVRLSGRCVRWVCFRNLGNYPILVIFLAGNQLYELETHRIGCGGGCPKKPLSFSHCSSDLIWLICRPNLVNMQT